MGVSSYDTSEKKVDTSADFAKSLATIATNLTRAMVEKPSLQNEKLRADIALTYANVKKTLAEAVKMEEEAFSLQIANKKAELLTDVQVLTNLLDVVHTPNTPKNRKHCSNAGGPSKRL
jgi:hypothetical protein